MTRTLPIRTTVCSRAGIGLLAATLVVAACSATGTSPSPTQPPGAPAGATVKVAQHPSLGAYLTAADGRSLYLFTPDSRDTATCVGLCASTWPALTADGSNAPTGDTGVTGTLGTISRSDGVRQVTYNGVPLYRFAQDAAGDTKGQGADGVWYLAGTSASAASGTITGGLGQGPGAAATPAPTPVSSAAPTPASTGGAADSYQIRNKSFPASITVVEGSTVTWTNADTGEHTVSADDGSFDSGKIAPGSTFQRTFPAAAAVKYHCNVDPAMTGTVSVTSIYNY